MFEIMHHGDEVVGEERSPATVGAFAYFFPEAPPLGVCANVDALDRLADAMVEPQGMPEASVPIPAVLTYFGQFVDHDMTAGTDRDEGLSVIDTPNLTPLPRAKVVRDRVNQRMGALNLDSLYGDPADPGPFPVPMHELLRAPFDRAKMWLGTTSDAGFGAVPLPADPGADLLRVGRLLREPHRKLTIDDLRALPEPARGAFVNDDGSIRLHRALIGDARNDENLIVAQLHLAFLRFHNRVVDSATRGSPDERFIQAQKLVRWHYQWLVIREFLPTICDPEVVLATIADDARLYRRLVAASPVPAPGLLPMPLEFSVAAFRFGHSMVRSSYDWNRFFGRPVDGVRPLVDRAPFRLLFDFTGGGGMPAPDGTAMPRLPQHWVVEWDRLAKTPPDFPDQAARPIDTALAEPLADLGAAPGGLGVVLRHLARRNLRRGLRLNIPSAQACIAGVEAATGQRIRPLAPEVLRSGSTGDAVREGGFDRETPLWFYVLKEAEVVGRGARLGPLGSRLVAETLVGAVVKDPASYWWQRGSDGGRWHPRDGAKPAGEIVDGIAPLLRAAGVL